MAGRCEICGKGPQFGHNVSHSKRHTNRRWLPNTHKVMILASGVVRRLSVCTRCLRNQTKVAKAS